MGGGGQAIAAKPAPLWPDAVALQADIYALEHPFENPARTAAAIWRLVLVLRAAIKGRTHVVALFPPIGRQKKEKASKAQQEIRAIYAELVLAFAPEYSAKVGGAIPAVSSIHGGINKGIASYKRDRWPHDKKLNQQPSRGDFSFDHLFWQLFRIAEKSNKLVGISRPTLHKIIRDQLSPDLKGRRY